MSSEHPTQYRVVGGSHNGELFQDQRAEHNVNEKVELTHVSMPHRTDATLREVYEMTCDNDGVPILRHSVTHHADEPLSHSLTMTRRKKN